MKVVIIGSGNVATVFGRKIVQLGHEVIQIVGRNRESTSLLASSLNTVFVNSISDVSMLADIYIIAVSDRSIPEVAAQLKLNSKLVVHTAGSVSKEVLSAVSSNYGVLYPLQTFRKENPAIPNIPVLVDANAEDALKTLMNFASTWADSVTVATDQERLKLHLAAVIANNFTNYLFTVASQLCYSNRLDFKLLYPLVEETILRIKETRPENVQTGPAVRNDIATIELHKKILASDLPALQLYDFLTTSIMNYFNRKNG